MQELMGQRCASSYIYDSLFIGQSLKIEQEG